MECCTTRNARREDESLSDRLTSGVEVSSMDMGSNVYIPLGERDTVRAYLLCIYMYTHQLVESAFGRVFCLNSL
jgi:hypothetical protein